VLEQKLSFSVDHFEFLHVFLVQLYQLLNVVLLVGALDFFETLFELIFLLFDFLHFCLLLLEILSWLWLDLLWLLLDLWFRGLCFWFIPVLELLQSESFNAIINFVEFLTQTLSLFGGLGCGSLVVFVL
jgi:hypothetical protein